MVVVALALLTLWRAQRARHAFQAARSHVQVALDAAGRLDFEEAETALTAAGADFARARGALSGADIALLSLIPPVGDNVRAARDLADAAALGIGGARQAVDAIALLPREGGRPVLPLNGGRIDTGVLDAWQAGLARARGDVVRAEAALDERPGTLGSVAEARHALRSSLGRGSLTLAKAADSLDLVRGVFAAPTGRYLLALENPAEMRGLGGMVLSYGELEVDGGRVRLARVGSVGEITLSAPAPVEVPPDFTERFSWQMPTQAWVNTNAGLDFPTAGQVMAAMYQSATGRAVDGVILGDSVFLARLGELVGPIEIGTPPRTIPRGQMQAFLLHDQYVGGDDTSARREMLADTAGRVVELLLAGRVDAYGVGSALSESVIERRLALWMRDPSRQAVVARLEADAPMPETRGDLLAVTVQNHTGHKADVFVRPVLTYEATVTATGAVVAETRVEVSNTLSAEQVARQPRYVVGPYRERPDAAPLLPAGWYRAWVNVYSSPGSYVIATTLTASQSPRVETEASHPVVSGFADVPPGQSRTIAVTRGVPMAYNPATGDFALTLLPQPRPQATVVHVVVHLPTSGWKSTSPGVVVEGRTARFEGQIVKTTEIRVHSKA